MSLGGIAIAIGAMVDAVIIMIENAHTHIELGRQSHWEIIRSLPSRSGRRCLLAAGHHRLVYPGSLLQAQEGRSFKPLAFTKTTRPRRRLLSITLAPVLMGYFIRGKIPPEEKNPINRFLIWLYTRASISSSNGAGRHCGGGRPCRLGLLPMELARHRPSAGWSGKDSLLADRKGIPFQHLGSNSCRHSTKGDLLTCRRCSQASRRRRREIIQQTDKIIKSFPEVPRLRKIAGRDGYRPRSIRHDRIDDHAQRREGLAGRYDTTNWESRRTTAAHAR